MPVLVDTNVLIRSLHPDHPHYLIAVNAVAGLRLREETLCLAPQNLIEFWAVATRPREENGLGMTPTQAQIELATLQRLFSVLPATAEVFQTWQRIVLSQRIIGKHTHDAHLVAVMRVYGVGSILTFNGGHFQHFPDISVLNPLDI